MRVIGCALLGMFLAGLARADDEELLARLAQWQADPIDLLTADPADLGLLPGLDAEQVAALIQLRDAGQLVDLEDLGRVRGLTPVHLEAIRPYVRIGSEAASRGLRWNFTGQAREAGPERWVQRWTAGAGTAGLELVTMDQTGRVHRGGVWAGLAGLDFAAGHLVVDTPTGILDLRSARSRLAGAAAPRRASVRLRTDGSFEPGWTGGSIGGPGFGVLLLRSSEGTSNLGVTLDASSEFLRGGLDARTGDSRAAVGAWAVHEREGARSWMRGTLEPGARMGALGCRVVRGRWVVGTDASRADGALQAGTDPVTGQRLDRAHAAWQLHARVRGSGWAIGSVWREVQRGLDPVFVRTVEFEGYYSPRGREPVRRLEAQVRLQPVRRATVRARLNPGAGDLVLSFSQQVNTTGVAELTGLSWATGSAGAELRLATAWVDGAGSRVWMVSRPGTGAYPVWLQPGMALSAAGFRWRAGGRSLGAWIWVAGAPGQGFGPGGGLSIRVEAGDLVRRLQGSARSRPRGPEASPPATDPWNDPAQRAPDRATPGRIGL